MICVISSVKSTNIKGLSVDPFNNCEPFDEFGYSMIANLKI